MKNLNFKNSILPFVYGALLIVLGILIMIFPNFWVKLFVVVFGLCSVAYGIYTLLPLKNLENSQYKTMSLIKSGISIFFGLLSVIIPIAVATTTWKVIVYVFAVSLIISSVLGFYSTSIIALEGEERKKAIFENVISLIVAIILFLISPISLGKIIIRVIGICTIIVGVILIALKMFSKQDIIITNAEVKDSDNFDDIISTNENNSSENNSDK